MYLFSLSEPSRDWKLLISSYFIRYIKKAISLRGTEISRNFGDFEKAIVWIPKSKTFILQAREMFGASLVAQLLKNLPAMLETWVGKIPWRRARLHTPVFWPGEFHGLYIVNGSQRVNRTEQLSLHFTWDERNSFRSVRKNLW